MNKVLTVSTYVYTISNQMECKSVYKKVHPSCFDNSKKNVILVSIKGNIN